MVTDPTRGLADTDAGAASASTGATRAADERARRRRGPRPAPVRRPHAGQHAAGRRRLPAGLPAARRTRRSSRRSSSTAPPSSPTSPPSAGAAPPWPTPTRWPRRWPPRRPRRPRARPARAWSMLDGAPLTASCAARCELRVGELIAYQEPRYAAALPGRGRAGGAASSTSRPAAASAVAEAYARGLHKLMAYKDEYEVARLHLRRGRGGAPRRRVRRRRQGADPAPPPLLRAHGPGPQAQLGPLGVPGAAARCAARGGCAAPRSTRSATRTCAGSSARWSASTASWCDAALEHLTPAHRRRRWPRSPRCPTWCAATRTSSWPGSSASASGPPSCRPPWSAEAAADSSAVLLGVMPWPGGRERVDQVAERDIAVQQVQPQVASGTALGTGAPPR